MFLFFFSIKNELVPWTSHVEGSHVRTKFYLSRTIGHTGFGALLLIEELKQKLQVYIYKCPRSILWIW